MVVKTAYYLICDRSNKEESTFKKHYTIVYPDSLINLVDNWLKKIDVFSKGIVDLENFDQNLPPLTKEHRCQDVSEEELEQKNRELSVATDVESKTPHTLISFIFEIFPHTHLVAQLTLAVKSFF